MRIGFGHIIGQHRAKTALRLLLIDRKIDGLLISGVAGTGKSTLLNSLYILVPKEQILAIPSSVSYDMLYDRLDTDTLFKQGTYRVRSGLLSQTSGKIVLLDNFNLFPEAILRTIVAHHASEGGYTLIAAFNPDEGAISSGILDRFPLFVELHNNTDIPSRIEVMRTSARDSQAAQEPDPYIEKGKQYLPKVAVKKMDLELSATLCREAYVLGHRADIVLLRAARAYAALCGRTGIKREDFVAVKDLALAHRVNNPVEETSPDNSTQEQQSPDENSTHKSDHPENHHQHSEPSNGKNSTKKEAGQRDSSTFSADAPAPNRQSPIGNVELSMDPITLAHRKVKHQSGFGTRVKCAENSLKGHFTRAIYPQKTPFEIALTATIRAAAPFQRLRPQQENKALTIYPSDFRAKKKEHRSGYTILFLVDTSGSMGVMQRMATVKAVIFELLKTAYIKRDCVGMVTFHGDTSDTILPFTRSFSRAKELLAEIETGGRTPLYLGLRKSYEMIATQHRRNPNCAPILVLVTDGRATSVNKGENQQDTLQDWARKLASICRRTIIVDTEQGFIRLRKAREIASIMNADMYHLEEMIKISTALK